MDENETDEPECTCIPEGAIITAELRVVSYLSPDGDEWKVDLSNDGSGGPLDPDRVNALAEWVKQVNSVEMIASFLHSFFCHDHDEDDE